MLPKVKKAGSPIKNVSKTYLRSRKLVYRNWRGRVRAPDVPATFFFNVALRFALWLSDRRRSRFSRSFNAFGCSLSYYNITLRSFGFGASLKKSCLFQSGRLKTRVTTEYKEEAILPWYTRKKESDSQKVFCMTVTSPTRGRSKTRSGVLGA